MEYQREETRSLKINYLYQKVTLQWKYYEEIDYSDEKAVIYIGGFTDLVNYQVQFHPNHTLSIINPTGT